MLSSSAAALARASALAPALGCLLQRGAFSTAAKEDYSIVMSKAMEVSTECASAPLPPGEGGVTFGVPLETFKRKVRARSGGAQRRRGARPRPCPCPCPCPRPRPRPAVPEPAGPGGIAATPQPRPAHAAAARHHRPNLPP
jgi:hypothetical protein